MFCNTQLDNPYVESGYNVYDVRSKGDYKDDLNAVSEFVSQTEVRTALDALNNKKFEACNMQVYAKFIGDWMREVS